MQVFGTIFDWFIRLLPAMALFSLFFAFDDGLRWLGLFGFVPLVMALHPSCPTCDPRAKACGKDSQWKTWPGI